MAWTGRRSEGPFQPPRGDTIIERVSPGTAPVALVPGDLAQAVAAARADIDAARARSDPRYLGYAQAALAPWWDAPDAPPDVLLLRATIRQHVHDFDGALTDLSAVLELR